MPEQPYKEPSILDYVKSLLTPWKGPPIEIPPLERTYIDHDQADQGEPISFVIPPPEGPTLQPEPAPAPIPEPEIEIRSRPSGWPWFALLALFLALVAQRTFEPGPGRTWITGTFLYLLAAIWLIYANLRGQWVIAPPLQPKEQRESFNVRLPAMWIGSLLAVLAFITLGGNLFTTLNVSLWLLSILAFLVAFWLPPERNRSWLDRLRLLTNPKWSLTIPPWALLVAGALILAVFFRAYHLSQVPPEMTSDHAEKLLDVFDVLHGQTHIFFRRNTGREFFQMYLTAGVIELFKTGYTFLSLKIGTVLGGLLTLPFIYLLGKELANRRAGLIALAFAGIAYWPNLISRIALRFTLYPLFFAPTLFFLLRGLRTSNRNDFILAGLFLGLGLNGYTPFRFVPFVVLVALGLYLLHNRTKIGLEKTTWGLSLLVLFSFLVFIPLLRYGLDDPSMLTYRSLTRLSSLERPLPGPAWQIFLGNLWRALTMFAWDDGDIWTFTIAGRPALDVVSGALFHLGVLLVTIRYFRRRNWQDLFLLVSIPLLMMPSILSLAFPNENPALNRASGAIVPVFLIIGLSLDGLLASIRSYLGQARGGWIAWGMALLLLIWSASQNYDLVFNQYLRSYRAYSWNTSEMGQVIRGFADSIGSPDNAWVIPFPYWVDTRLVGMYAGYPTKDYALTLEDIPNTLADPGPKMFLFYPEHREALIFLQSIYPQGTLKEYQSNVEGKDFMIFFAPVAR